MLTRFPGFVGPEALLAHAHAAKGDVERADDIVDWRAGGDHRVDRLIDGDLNVQQVGAFRREHRVERPSISSGLLIRAACQP